MFYSDYPTYFPKIYGPSTFVNVLAFNDFASCLAIRVLPVPGGPYKRIPFTCFRPNFYIKEWGNLLEANALRNRLVNYLSKPPMPSASNVKLLANIFFCMSFADLSLIFWSGEATHVNLVSTFMNENPSYVPITLSIVITYLMVLYNKTNVWSIATK